MTPNPQPIFDTARGRLVVEHSYFGWLRPVDEPRRGGLLFASCAGDHFKQPTLRRIARPNAASAKVDEGFGERLIHPKTLPESALKRKRR